MEKPVTNEIKRVRRRQRKKELEIQMDNVKLADLLEILGEYQYYIFEKNNSWRKFYFNWENATEEYVELREECKWYNWLYPIKFYSTLAFVLEILQYNINDILINREKTLEVICCKLKINQEQFEENLRKIQDLLITFNKVKVCKNGKVVMMENVW